MQGPNEPMGPQIRDPKDTHSAFSVIREKFFEKSSFHLHNGYPHNVEAREKIKELIQWYSGDASWTPAQVEAILGVLKVIRPLGNARQSR